MRIAYLRLCICSLDWLKSYFGVRIAYRLCAYLLSLVLMMQLSWCKSKPPPCWGPALLDDDSLSQSVVLSTTVLVSSTQYSVLMTQAQPHPGYRASSRYESRMPHLCSPSHGPASSLVCHTCAALLTALPSLGKTATVPSNSQRCEIRPKSGKIRN